jgi:hypothetical protein
VPSLPTSNRFAVLVPELEEKSETLNDEDTFAKNPLPKGDTQPQKWEQHLPMALVRAIAPSPNLLRVKIEIQTMDTAVVVGAHMLLDSGTTGLFINEGFVRVHGLTCMGIWLCHYDIKVMDHLSIIFGLFHFCDLQF